MIGVIVGWLANIATNDWIKALGDGLIKLITMVIAPIIFCTVVNPVPGMAIVFSVDKFMSEVRALTNITGNGVATVFVSWSRFNKRTVKSAMPAIKIRTSSRLER